MSLPESPPFPDESSTPNGSDDLCDEETAITEITFLPDGRLCLVTQVANSLKAIISQKLLPLANGKGQVLASEICIVTNAVRNHIRERTVHQIYSEMQTGRKHQMQTMDGALLDLYQRGEITYDTALSNAREPSHIQHKTGPASPPKV